MRHFFVLFYFLRNTNCVTRQALNWQWFQMKWNFFLFSQWTEKKNNIKLLLFEETSISKIKLCNYDNKTREKYVCYQIKLTGKFILFVDQFSFISFTFIFARDCFVICVVFYRENLKSNKASKVLWNFCKARSNN